MPSDLPDEIHYADEKFLTALYALTGPSSQRERLRDVYVYHLIHVKPESLPESMRYRFKEFRDALTRIPGPAGQGATHATVAAMTEGEVSDMVTRFLTLYHELQDHIRPPT